MLAGFGIVGFLPGFGGFHFVSGQAGIVPKTGEKAGDGFETQARHAFSNLEACLACSGGTMDDVVKVIGHDLMNYLRGGLNAFDEADALACE